MCLLKLRKKKYEFATFWLNLSSFANIFVITLSSDTICLEDLYVTSAQIFLTSVYMFLVYVIKITGN